MAQKRKFGVSGDIGETIPPNDLHGVSVSLPTWESAFKWGTKDATTLSRMKTGYPRFFIHRSVEKLARKIAAEFDNTHGAAASTRLGLLLPSAHHASQCREFLQDQADEVYRGQTFSIKAGLPSLKDQECLDKQVDWARLEFHAVLYPSALEKQARSFWQHTGFGISSRYAEVLLKHFDQITLTCRNPCSTCSMHLAKPRSTEEMFIKTLNEALSIEGDASKDILRRRIARFYSTDRQRLTAENVLLYPSGMTAGTNVAAAVLQGSDDIRNSCEIVCYGFLYVDTVKTISKVLGINTTLYSESELDRLETELKNGRKIRAVFLEVAGNPLLHSPDLRHIRILADKFHFAVIADDTVATSINVDLLSLVDVVWTSLTKMFSGACNVMGGSVVLCPQSPYFEKFRHFLSESFIDSYFPPDAIIMEENSRDFEPRILKSNDNAALLRTILEQHETVQEVFYPKGSASQKFFDEYKKRGAGYGHLLSITFKSPQQAIAFFDALDVAKGPSLGTNFTLACPYTLFAHFNEMEWAAKYGVTEHLVRISVGLEEPEILRNLVVSALRAAEIASLNQGAKS